jgi:hypothetical protein
LSLPLRASPKLSGGMVRREILRRVPGLVSRRVVKTRYRLLKHRRSIHPPTPNSLPASSAGTPALVAVAGQSAGAGAEDATAGECRYYDRDGWILHRVLYWRPLLCGGVLLDVEGAASVRVADPKPGQRIIEDREGWEGLRRIKLRGCRVCGVDYFRVQLHHLVGRDLGGDDVPDNLIPLCPEHHQQVEERKRVACSLVRQRLSPAELRYILNKKGPDFLERYYGVMEW